MLEGPEDDLQDRLTDLAELVPDFPIDASEFDDFWNGFRMIAPEVPFTDELPKPRRGSERSDRIAELGLGSSDLAASAESGGLALIDFFVPQIPR